MIRIHKEKNLKKKRELMARLTREGDFDHFEKMARLGIDSKINVRKCLKTTEMRVCPRCHGFFSNALFNRHTKRCLSKLKKPRDLSFKSTAQESKFIMAAAQLGSENDRDFAKHIVGEIKNIFK